VALALHGAGAAVVSLTLRTPTLDDVFLQLTGSHLQGDASDDGADRSAEHAHHDHGRPGAEATLAPHGANGPQVDAAPVQGARAP
jgi:ABC-2 type transport system ATP-binding protein